MTALQAAEITDLHRTYAERLSARHARMRDVSDVYYNRKKLPVPELAKFNEEAGVPNLTQLGTDQLARRIASVLPTINCPSTRPGIKTADDKADLRRMVLHGWWQLSKMPRLQMQRSRWFVTYASAPAVIRPDPKLEVPRWEIQSPFNVFPGPMQLGSCTPEDAVVVHQRTYKWLIENYPEAMFNIRRRKDQKPSDVFTVLEHIDADNCTWVVLASDDDLSEWDPNRVAGADEETLTVFPNRAGMCTVVVPERAALDAPAGQFDTIMGMYVTEAMMMAFQVIAARKAIWPETWVVNPNGGITPTVAQVPNSETGEPGVLLNGILDRAQIDPSFASQNTMDHLQSAQRQTAALPPELGGTGGENVRTGRRGTQIMSASIDYTIAEAQDTFASALHEEHLRAIAVDRHYFNKTKSFYVSTKGSRGKVTYKPSDIWDDSVEHIVEYSIAGSDLNDLVVAGGQRIGQGSLSTESFMALDPLVSDVDAELSRIRLEQAERAFFGSLQEMLAAPDAPWQAPEFADFAARMAKGEKWYDAVAEINRDLQERQAQGAEPGSPEAMPGLAPPGAPGEIPTIPGLGPTMDDMTGLLGQLAVTDMALRAR